MSGLRTVPPLALLLLWVPAMALGAQTVELLCAQPEGTEAPALTEGLISGCLDSLFSGGFIATNAPPLALGHDSWLDPSLGLAAAREGYVDFLVLAYITYGPSAAVSGRFLPISLEFRVVRVADGKALGEGRVPVRPDSLETIRDLDAVLRGLGSALGAACLPAFSRRAGFLSRGADGTPATFLACSQPRPQLSGGTI
jgi:hypothetical protein